VLQQQAKTTNWFAIHWQEGNAGHARLGISVGKRAIPTAVGRNRVKRLIRECFRNIAKQGTERDVVIRLRKQLGYSDQQEAIRALSYALKNILTIAK
jgi:ribonuclease P protein component